MDARCPSPHHHHHHNFLNGPSALLPRARYNTSAARRSSARGTRAAPPRGYPGSRIAPGTASRLVPGLPRLTWYIYIMGMLEEQRFFFVNEGECNSRPCNYRSEVGSLARPSGSPCNRWSAVDIDDYVRDRSGCMFSVCGVAFESFFIVVGWWKNEVGKI